jgi:hypothetical protein
MSVSLRSHFVTGVAAVAVAALVASPTTASAHPLIQPTERPVTARVDLAASVKPIILEPLRPEQLATARDAIRRIDPESTFATAAAAPVPAPLNAASDWFTNAYEWVQYWVSYGVDLADYVLGFIPFGYFIGDQINIFYDFLITPIADSVVYGLINPILNDPLNFSTWVNGLVNVGQTSINAAINTGIAEFNYFFGWLIPPLPPLPIPPFPLAAVQTVTQLETVEDVSLLSTALEEVTNEKVGTEIEPETEVTDVEVTDPEVVTPEVTTPEVPEVVTPEVPEVVAPEVPEVVAPEVPVDETTPVVAPETDDETIAPTTPTKLTPTKLTPIKSTLGTVSAQGEVRGGATSTPATDTKPAATASSDKEKPAPESTPSGASAEQTDKTSATDKTDSDKNEKNDKKAASD